MIVCPNCKEEIDNDSWYCDQCGQHLAYCSLCGRVGLGKRCTNCGGVMVPPEEFFCRNSNTASAVSKPTSSTQPGGSLTADVTLSDALPMSTPQLMLVNESMGIRIVGINGAIIGRRQGPYAQLFQQNLYVSGVHAQIKYDAQSGWCVADKHSSNGTKLNDRQLVPDVDTPMKNGDVVIFANVALKVCIN